MGGYDIVRGEHATNLQKVKVGEGVVVGG
ncbi:uncharacterized protein G2W53_009076 [Senna tora]|uniref:Uncharacterized protein n=1 Tax=Senna tora TaxID=362788 RepID=A0A834WXG1_9FABA|nr:uncharacterized protein G2W53_009076 [Senna tora]